MFVASLNQYNFSNFISEVSSQYNIENDLLVKRMLLQLPKFDDNDLLDYNKIKNEIIRLGSKIKTSREKNPLPPLNHRRIEVKELTLKTVPENIAKIIHENYHYIGSHRTESFYKGLYSENDDESIYSLITLSSFDLNNIHLYIPREIKHDEVLVVSRVYSFRDAPKNSISFMIGSIVKWIRKEHPKVKMLLTYVNPNLGFFGSSLKASNWFFYGKEKGICYAYFDEDYITLRELGKKMNIFGFEKSNYFLSERLKFSVQPLMPLELYAFFIDRKLRERYSQPFNHDIVKNPSIA